MIIHIDLFIHYHDTSTTPAMDWHGSSLHRWENTAFDLVTYPFYERLTRPIWRWCRIRLRL